MSERIPGKRERMSCAGLMGTMAQIQATARRLGIVTELDLPTQHRFSEELFLQTHGNGRISASQDGRLRPSGHTPRWTWRDKSPSPDRARPKDSGLSMVLVRALQRAETTL
ncbi:hypothetical protein AJ79_03489 [Helicocarpus griseus UAMH5409]|uniref:Uncharacterized protein n=1 Tax=Helicocarpus griseus UAMH5409 TaxID=1447875 RepID=A0A2B7XXZ2_9EURO|nr:hypothetical protein AJ79_03489 [Helicocarpus griseus UAMH5409]